MVALTGARAAIRRPQWGVVSARRDTLVRENSLFVQLYGNSQEKTPPPPPLAPPPRRAARRPSAGAPPSAERSKPQKSSRAAGAFCLTLRSWISLAFPSGSVTTTETACQFHWAAADPQLS